MTLWFPSRLRCSDSMIVRFILEHDKRRRGDDSEVGCRRVRYCREVYNESPSASIPLLQAASSPHPCAHLAPITKSKRGLNRLISSRRGWLLPCQLSARVSWDCISLKHLTKVPHTKTEAPVERSWLYSLLLSWDRAIPHSIGTCSPEEEQTMGLQVSPSASWSAEGVEPFLWNYQTFE